MSLRLQPQRRFLLQFNIKNSLIYVLQLYLRMNSQIQLRTAVIFLPLIIPFMFLLNSKFQIPNSKKPTWNLE